MHLRSLPAAAGALLLALVLVAAACGDSADETVPVTDPEAPLEAADPVAVPSAEVARLIDLFGTPVGSEGEDPLATLPPPVECDPDRDVGSGADYFPLASMEGGPTDPTVEGAEAAEFRTFDNDQGQSFGIVINGGSENAVAAFIADASVCLERVPGGDGPEALPGPELDLALLAATLDATGRPLEELVDLRDELESAAPTSLAQVLVELGIDPAVVRDDALSRAGDVVALYGDRLQDPGGDASTVLDFFINEEGAPVLVPIADPSAPALGDDSVFVELDSLSEDAPQDEFIWFAIDPKKNKGWVYYRAKCRSEIWAKIKAWDRNMKLYVWRSSPYRTIGTRYVNSATQSTSSWIHAKYSRSYTFDASVYVYNNSSRYSLYGGWYEGSGGGC